MLELRWQFGADTVMGGVSQGYVQTDGNAARLTGTVSLENNGGFIQMSADIGPLRGRGLQFETRGDGGSYFVSLRTTALARPWQSFRYPFAAGANWSEVTVPWTALSAHRTEATFDPGQLRRIGILAVGEARPVDVAVRALRLWQG